jgi:hypothetical protein
VVPDVLGNTSVADTKTKQYEHGNRGSLAFTEDYEGVRGATRSSEKNMNTLVTQKIISSANAGDPQAQEDYVKLAKKYLEIKSTYSTPNLITVDRGGVVPETTEPNSKYLNTTMAPITNIVGLTPNQRKQKSLKDNTNKLIELTTTGTLREQFEMAKQLNINFNDMKDYEIAPLYNEVETMLDPTLTQNKGLRTYLGEVWENTLEDRRLIDSRQRALISLQGFQKNKIEEVAAKAAVNTEYGSEWSDAFLSYFDDDGYIVDKKTFVENMEDLGYEPNEIAQLYDYDTKVSKRVARKERKDKHTQRTERKYEDGKLAKNLNKVNVPGIHDMWKRAFSEFATIEGDRAYYEIAGLGDEAAMGMNWSHVDPTEYKSVGTQGALSYLRESVASHNAIFTTGGFRTGEGLDDIRKDEEQSAEAKEITSLLLDNLTYSSADVDDDDRLILNMTYSHIAADDENKVGLNVKVNRDFYDDYQGSENNEGPLRGKDYLLTEGITIYLNKSETGNTITRGTNETPVSRALLYQGEFEFDQYPEYIKNAKIKVNPDQGTYMLTAEVASGINENGGWEYRSLPPVFMDVNSDVNDFVAQYDYKFLQMALDAKALKQNWLSKNSE